MTIQEEASTNYFASSSSYLYLMPSWYPEHRAFHGSGADGSDQVAMRMVDDGVDMTCRGSRQL